MAKFFVVTVSVLFVLHVVAAGKTGYSCSVAGLKADVEKALMRCMIHDPGLMLEIMENLEHPEKMMQIDFICKNRGEMAKLANCMIHEFATCLPTTAQKMVAEVFPNEDRWNKVLKLVCDNQGVLSDQCMSKIDTQNFMQCYMGKLQGLAGLVSSLGTSKNVNPLLCKVIRWDEQCFTANSGSCSEKYIKLTMDIVEMIFSLPNCPSILGADTKMGDALGSLLVHGQPLIWQPQGEAKYKIGQ